MASKKTDASNINVMYENRAMKSYPVLEPELDALEITQENKTFFYSISSGAGTVFLTLLISLLTVDDNVVSEKIVAYIELGTFVATVVFILSSIMALRSNKKTKSMIEKIKQKQHES